MYDENYLYVQIRIPLSAYDSRFRVYKPHVADMPISSNNTAARTRVEGLPENYAISLSNKFCFEISELNKCVGDTLKFCANPIPVQDAAFPTCTMAIFLNEPTAVKRLCTMTYIELIQPRRILKNLGEGHYLSLAFKTDTWQLICGRSPSKQI